LTLPPTVLENTDESGSANYFYRYSKRIKPNSQGLKSMARASASSVSEENNLSLAELIPPRILPRVLGRWDLIVVYISIIYASYGSGQMAGAGWQSLSIWILAYLIFLVPAGMCSLELGNLFPEEGGVYVWASKTMGKLPGFMGGWLSWMPVFGAITPWTAIVVSYFSTAFGWELQLWQQVGLQVLAVWAAVFVALFSLRSAQKVVNRLFYIYAALSILTFVVAIAYAIANGSATPLPSSAAEWMPNLQENGAVFALAVLLLLGVETPFNMGVEMKSVNKAAPWMVFGGSFILGAFYLMTTSGVLMTTPLGEADPYVALAVLYGKAGLGWLVGVTGFLYGFCAIAQHVCYQYSYSRLLFISGIEKHLPKVFAYVDPRTRTPVTAILMQGAIITAIVLIMYSNSNLTVATQVLLASITVVWCISNYFFIFPVAIARRIFPHLYSEPGRIAWKIPGGMIGAWLTILIATIGNTIAIYYCFMAPWVPDMPVSAWAPQVATVSGIAIAIGFIIYFINLKQSGSVNVDDELAQYAFLESDTPEDKNS
jgi:amino acid transporter